MTAADLDAVLAIEAIAHEAPWTRGNFADSLAAQHQATLMLDAHTLLGYGVVMPLPGGDVNEAELLNITINPAWQKQGLGQRLLDHLCAEARRVGAGRMFLEVRASNRAAHALYAKRGFQQIGTRRDYYACQDGRREDAIVMAKAL